MSTERYLLLSAMMFFQFAIWGAWAPILASHLVNLRMTGKQIGWIYATLWLGCIVSPFLGSQIADRWMATQNFLCIAHLLGGVVLLVAARRERFWSLFALMGIYSLLYAPTLPLVFSLMSSHLTDAKTQAGGIRVWGTIGWIVSGLLITLWRNIGKFKVRGSDALTFAGILSVIFGVLSYFLPHTPPPVNPGNPLAFVEAFKMLSDSNFLIFLIISFVVTTELQFYYVPTAPFLEDIGVKSKNVPGVMTLAQFAEILGMAVLLPLLLPKIGFRWVLALGVIAWPLRYIVFAAMRPLWLVISSLPLHGIGYTFFFFAGQMYVDDKAPADIKASAQALITVATLGFGNFFGTQITGVIMDVFKKDGKFQWRPIFIFPCVLTILCAIAFLVFFK